MTNKSYDKLINSVPTYERTSELINEVFRVVGRYLDLANDDITVNMNEVFIDTANKALELHARDLGVSINSNLNLKQKRELITAYYRASFEQTNEATIKNIASSFSGGSVDIIPSDIEGIFKIKFIDVYGTPTNMDGLQETLKTILPAHLDVTYEYSYFLIRDVTKLTIGDLHTKTLSQFAWRQKEE